MPEGKQEFSLVISFNVSPDEAETLRRILSKTVVSMDISGSSKEAEVIPMRQDFTVDDFVDLLKRHQHRGTPAQKHCATRAGNAILNYVRESTLQQFLADYDGEQLLRIPNFGRRSLAFVTELLRQYGMFFGMSAEEYEKVTTNGEYPSLRP